MQVPSISVSPVSFGYHSILKDEYRQNPEMREHVKFGIYGGRLSLKDHTFEHLRCKSKGGTESLSNGALATQETNSARGNKPLARFLNKEMFEKYAKEFLGWKAKLFNNEKYIKGIAKTIEEEGVDLGDTLKHLNIKA